MDVDTIENRCNRNHILIVILNWVKQHFPLKADRQMRNCDRYDNDGASNNANSDCGSITNKGNGDGIDDEYGDCEDATDADRSCG